MSLPTDWAVGDPGHAAAHDAVAAQVNTNTTAIAANTTAIGGKLDKANNLSDLPDKAAAIANLGLSKVLIQTDGITSLGIFIQAADPDTTDPGKADSTDAALWFFPVP